jgi:hypothetical protein
MTRLAFIICLFASQAWAQEIVAPVNEYPVANVNKTGDVGLGILAGTPTAFNIKFWDSEATGTNLNLSYAGGDLAVMADYLWHFRKAGSFDQSLDRPSVIVPYIGIGLVGVFSVTDDSKSNKNDRPLYRRTNDQDGAGLGARIPIGLEFLPERQRFGVFAELAPGSIITPTSFSFLQAGVGGRYYF